MGMQFNFAEAVALVYSQGPLCVKELRRENTFSLVLWSCHVEGVDVHIMEFTFACTRIRKKPLFK